MMEEQFGWRTDQYCPNAVKILDTEDLQCLRFARQQAFKQDRDFNDSDLVNDLAKREIAAILRCDLSLIISPYEIALLVEYFKVDPDLLHFLPFMVDLTQLPDKSLAFEQRQHFITIGNFRHASNWDAVLYLRSLWPKIRQHLPQAECHVYGAYPPPKATALNNPKIGFLVKGWADDASLVMGQARVCLAPLRFGAGLKGKLLDAMITQTPNITTPIGAEGMADTHPWPGIITRDGKGFIQAAITLYQDQDQWAVSQQYCHKLLQQTYSAKTLGIALIDRINSISADLKQHRLANFTGTMLKHHTLASIRYMSQWITAKNK
jgi:glycosyltransferase involved in cell wall biosynthesis